MEYYIANKNNEMYQILNDIKIGQTDKFDKKLNSCNSAKEKRVFLESHGMVKMPSDGLSPKGFLPERNDASLGSHAALRVAACFGNTAIVNKIIDVINDDEETKAGLLTKGTLINIFKVSAKNKSVYLMERSRELAELISQDKGITSTFLKSSYNNEEDIYNSQNTILNEAISDGNIKVVDYLLNLSKGNGILENILIDQFGDYIKEENAPHEISNFDDFIVTVLNVTNKNLSVKTSCDKKTAIQSSRNLMLVI